MVESALGMRRLAAARVIKEVRKYPNLPLGAERLSAWFEDEGRWWLVMAGMQHLATVPADELVALILQYAPEAFDATRRCINCTHLVQLNGSGRVGCELGMWQEQGRRQEEYALLTVRSRFDGCEMFERDENGTNRRSSDESADGGDQ